jgi:hypothetical protein
MIKVVNVKSESDKITADTESFKVLFHHSLLRPRKITVMAFAVAVANRILPFGLTSTATELQEVEHSS